MDQERLNILQKKFPFIELFLKVYPLMKCPLCRKKVKIEKMSEGLYCPNCREWVTEYTRYERPQITLDNIKIQKISKELMLYIPKAEKLYSPLADIEKISSVYLISEGKKQAIYSQQDIYYNEIKEDIGNGFSKKKPDLHIPGETILQAIRRFNSTPEFIVLEERGYNIISHYSQENWRIVIFKMAKNEKIEDIIKETINPLKEFEEQKVEAEIDF